MNTVHAKRYLKYWQATYLTSLGKRWTVLAEQEKNRVEHYVPLHTSVISAIKEVLNNDFGEKDDALKRFHLARAAVGAALGI